MVGAGGAEEALDQAAPSPAQRRTQIEPLQLQRDVSELGHDSRRAMRADKLLVCSSILLGAPPPNAPARRSLSSPSPAPRVGNEASCSDAFCLAPIGDDTFYLLSYALCTQGKHGFCLSKLQHLVELSLKAGRCKGSRPAGQLYHTY